MHSSVFLNEIIRHTIFITGHQSYHLPTENLKAITEEMHKNCYSMPTFSNLSEITVL
jgi:hypothetical protein